MCFAINNLLCEVYISYTKKTWFRKSISLYHFLFLTDCILVGGVAERVSIKPHYRFTRDKKGNLVKASPERTVKFLKVVAFKGETIEGEIARYEAQIPDSCKIEDEGEE